MRAPLPFALLLCSLPALAAPPAAAPEPTPTPAAASPQPTSASTPTTPNPDGTTREPAKVGGDEARTNDDATGADTPQARAPRPRASRRDQEDADDPDPPPATASARTQDDGDAAWKPRARIAGWVLLGAAGAALLSSVATFGAEGYYASRWNDDARCLVGGRYRFSTCGDDYDRATRTDTLAIELAVASGAVGVVAAVLLLSTKPPSSRKARRAVSFRPGPGSLGISLVGTL